MVALSLIKHTTLSRREQFDGINDRRDVTYTFRCIGTIVSALFLHRVN
jgi:hypothetical protein